MLDVARTSFNAGAEGGLVIGMVVAAVFIVGYRVYWWYKLRGGRRD